ncbi:MAG: nuclear transport factor 2 family protein [Thermoleophilaceae bacterium]
MAVVQRNAEVVRDAFQRWAGADFASVVELYAPEVIMDTGGVVVARAVYRGREEVSAALVDLAARRPSRAVRELHLEESGDWVIAIAEFADGLHSAMLFRLRGGLICHIEARPSVEDARRRLRMLTREDLDPPAWAPIGSHDPAPGHLEVGQGEAILCLGDRRIPTMLPAGLDERVSDDEPVLLYLDEEGELLGWYLPEQQLGVDLRVEEGAS